MSGRILPRARHLAFATLIGALTVIVRAVVQPILGDTLPFVFAFPATVLVSLLWGMAPGMVAAAVCALGVWLPGVPPTLVHQSDPSIQLGSFMVSALFISFLGGRLGRARMRSTAAVGADRAETPLGVWLRAVLLGALFVPLAALVAASWWTLDRAQAASRASLSHASDLAYTHAERTFMVALEIAARANQASGLPDDLAHQHERDIHVRLADLSAGTRSIVNETVWDASASLLARSDFYPVDRSSSIADRDYFQRLKTSPQALSISRVMTGRQSGKLLFSMAIRRPAPAGVFNGILSVALSPSFFSEYYETLAHEEPTQATFALLRSDGAILACWPNADTIPYLVRGSGLFPLMAAGEKSGRLTTYSDAGRDTQMVSYRRVGELPVYVVTGISRSAMLSGWVRSVGMLAAILLPTTAGLVYVTWVALRKTRAESIVSLELQAQIRARAEAERRMLEAQRLETLALVTGGVAHDLNNMLAVITSSVHVHKIKRPETLDDKELAAIGRSVKSGVRLTRQLLSFSKKQALRPEIVRFQTWLPAADALVRSSLGAKASWKVSVDEDTRPVKVDPGELELALVNVVVNAKLAMPDGGELRVHVSNDAGAPADAPMVIVCVMDTGQGIPEDVLPRIFEPFFTTRQKGVGSGLGLTQVQGFCLQSGGHVTVDSKPHQGTTLCMHLPAQAHDAPDAPASMAAAPERLQARLLLVEDNDDVGRITEQMLESSGSTVVRVASADAAFEYLREAASPPDLVLSDIAMPGSMNGIDLALQLRRLYPQLPVMLHTGYAEQIEEGLAQGLHVFQKPVPPEVLLAELRTLLARARAAT